MGPHWDILLTEYPCEEGNNHLLIELGKKKIVLEEKKLRTLEIIFKK